MSNREFPGQQDGEVVQLVFRRHYSVMSRELVGVVAVLLISFTLLAFWHNQSWVWYVPIVGLVLAGLLAFNAWVRWYYSVYILTNRRIQQQLQSNLFRKTTIDLYLDKVQNISYNIRGLGGSLAGYGTIVLQTIVGDMIMTRIANCEMVYHQLSAAVQAAQPMDNINKGDDFGD